MEAQEAQDTNPLVLITGGAGFVGSHLCWQLAERGYRIRILDNLRRANLPAIRPLLDDGRATLIDTDIRYVSAIDRVIDGADYVVHLAATSINRSQASPAESVDVDIRCSEHVFAAAAEHDVRRVVFASSASVYGPPEALPMTEDGRLNPQTPYCLGKLAAEHLLQYYGRSAGLEWNILRFFNVYGPGQHTDAYYTAVVSIFLSRLLNGEPPLVDGSGEQTMDLVHVRATSPGPSCVRSNPTEAGTSATSAPGCRPRSPRSLACSSASSVWISSPSSRRVACRVTPGGRHPPRPRRRSAGNRRST